MIKIIIEMLENGLPLLKTVSWRKKHIFYKI